MIPTLINTLKSQLTQIEKTLPLTQKGKELRYTSLELSLDTAQPLLPHSINHCFFLSQPDSGLDLLGLGSFIAIKTQGEQRFNTIKEAFFKLKTQWHTHNLQQETSKNHSPIAFLTFAFDENDPMEAHWQGLPNSQLNIPIVLIKQVNSVTTLIVNIKLFQASYDATFKTISKYLKIFLNSQTKNIEKKSESTIQIQNLQKNKQNWQVLAQQAINQIKKNKFDKLVTTRQQLIHIKHAVSVPRLIKRLIKHYPCCTIFSYQLNNKTIVSASPEKLVTLNYPDIQSNALGGTILRQSKSRQDANNSANNDANNNAQKVLPFFLKPMAQQSQAELFESKKLLKEHHFISQTIYQSLDPFCHTLKMPVSPYLMKLHHLYHLETPIQGKLMAQYDIFDTIKALHPTPAVAGLPTRQAQQWLLANENYHRGWYTGAFGWLDGKNNGDIAVMLRCTLIHSTNKNMTQLDLFSGAGLVTESTPDAEWRETELKMQTILETL